jgi:hypothetical protein
MRLRFIPIRGASHLLVVVLLVAGCRAHPGQLAISVVEGYIDARDVQQRGQELIGRPLETADGMFGRRHDTLHDLETGHTMLVFTERGRKESETYYLVDVCRNGQIGNLLKVKYNIEGVTDLHQNREIRNRVLGKSRAAAEADARLGPALRVVKSEENGQTICVYRPQGLLPKTYTDYCLLWYDRRNGVCVDNAMLGVIAGFLTDKLDAAHEEDYCPPAAPSSQPTSEPVKTGIATRK